MPMNVSMPKLKAVIIYFAENTNPQYLGKVKLMKLLYFLDFQHVKRHGAPVLGDQYYHLPMGPVPTVSKRTPTLVPSISRFLPVVHGRYLSRT